MDHTQHNTEPPIGPLYAALAKAQATFPNIVKNREVEIRTRERGSYTFRYADLAAIMEAVRPSLTREGLSIMQPLTETQDGELFITTTLAHESGARIESRVRVGRGHQDPKQLGALVSYMRRYAVSAMLCIAADDDIDQDGGDAGGDAAGAARAPANDNAPPNEPAYYAQEAFERNLPAWRDAIESGRKTPQEVIALVSSKAPLTAEQTQAINNLKAPQEPQA